MGMICLEFCWEIFEMDVSRLFVLFNVEETCKPQTSNRHEMKVQKSGPSPFFLFKILIYSLHICNYVCAQRNDNLE